MLNLIIFGTRGVTTTPDQGDFWCPTCEEERHYEHKRVRRFFTLYFIPLVPLDVLGEYIECATCSCTFKPEVLHGAAAAKGVEYEAEFHGAVRRIMVLMMLADGVIDDEEITTIREIYKRIASFELSEERVRKEAEEARADGRGVHDYLKSLIGSLNDSGKEMVVKAAYFVAAADGTVSQEEEQLLLEVGKALELSASQYRAIVDGLKAA